MTKITLNHVSDLTVPTTAATTINGDLDTIQTSMDNTLSRDGASPNQMESVLDMNGWQILNLPQPASANSPLRLQDLDSFVGGGTVTNIPAGGNTGDRLVKTSNVDYNIGWSSESSDLVAGSNISVTGTSPATIATVQNPNFTTSVTTPSFTLNGSTVTGVTGTGNLVGSTSPILVTPVIGNATGTSLNLSGLTASSAVATDGSKNLTSVANTGTGNNVLATSPTLTTPALGTPSSAVLTNATGTASGLTAGNVITNANLTGVITSVGNATSIASQTGTGTKFVTDTSPTLVTPVIGAATGTSLVLTNNSATGFSVGKNGSTNPSFVVNSSAATQATGLSVLADNAGNGASLNVISSGTNETLGLNGKGSGTVSIAGVSTGNIVLGRNVTSNGTVTFSPTTSGVVGTPTNDSATTGIVGEYVTATGGSVACASNATVNATSISLTAGDWDVQGTVIFNFAATTTMQLIAPGISTTSATLGGVGTLTSFNLGSASTTAPNGNFTLVTPTVRLSLASTTTVFLVGTMTYGTSTASILSSLIRARRAR